MNYEIKHADVKREGFGNYRYVIHQNGRLVAHYWHDSRGEEHGIEFLNGKSEGWPVGRMIDFIEGGGPKPLRLSSAAVTYLQQELGS